MRGNPVLVLVENRDTKYSINALVAAIDSSRAARIVIVDKFTTAIETARRMSEKDYKVIIGVSLMTEHFVSNYDEIIEFVRQVKALDRQVLLVAGGSHATGDPVGMLRAGFDVVVVGEGEETLQMVIESWVEQGFDGLYEVRGLVLPEEERPIYTGRRRPLRLDDYWSFPWWRRRFSPIEITRGCFWGCRYCETWFIHGGRERHRSIESILEHVKVMVEHGLKDVRFITPNSLGYGAERRGERRLDIVEEMLSKVKGVVSGIGGRVFFGSFPSEVRPEYVDREAARVIKTYADNKRVIVGAQSGSERILRLLNRGHTPEDVMNAVDALVAEGLKPEVDFIFGLPGESEEDIEASLKLAEYIVRRGGRVHAHTFMPLPGTPLEGAPGGRVPLWLRKRLYRLIGVGGLYGQWEKQEKLAAKIHEFYEKKIILGLRGWRLLRLKPGRV